MTITFKHGDLFQEQAEALVNTVNCVGVMGKGVALEAKRRWPDNFLEYRRACEAKKLKPGQMLVFDRGGLVADGPRYIVNFPTKDHWRGKSKLSYVSDGLDELVHIIESYGLSSIAVPPLGCGNGGLDWAVVKPIIHSKLSGLTASVVVFEPTTQVDAPEHTGRNSSMTFERAVLLKGLNHLEPLFDGAFDRIALQKLTYFLQVLGVNYGLRFSRNEHGPYSETLRKAFVAFEEQGVLSGFTSEERLSHVTPKGVALSHEFLSSSDDLSDQLIDRLSKLIQGYESPFGLELLSSVHWLARHEGHMTVTDVISGLRSWNDRKGNSFTNASIEAAFERLVEDELIALTLTPSLKPQ